MRTAPFIDDVVVRPEYLPRFLPRLQELLKPYDLLYTIAGHAGDGNFHIIPLVKSGEPKLKVIIPELSKKVYDLVAEYHGSITAEHNDGLVRSAFLKQMYGEKVYNLFVETKKIFDPKNIFNPGKKVNSSFVYAMEHLRKS
jgi:FAD/FMN-containing dehydrogenase